MTGKPEITVIFEHYSLLEGGYTTTHRLTTALGLKRVLGKAALKEMGHFLRLTFCCRKDAEALGLREEANGEWVATDMDPIQVDIVDEKSLDFPGFLELLSRTDRAICEREKLHRMR